MFGAHAPPWLLSSSRLHGEWLRRTRTAPQDPVRSPDGAARAALAEARRGADAAARRGRDAAAVAVRGIVAGARRDARRASRSATAWPARRRDAPDARSVHRDRPRAGALGTWQVDAREEPRRLAHHEHQDARLDRGLHRLQLEPPAGSRPRTCASRPRTSSWCCRSGTVFVADVPGGVNGRRAHRPRRDDVHARPGSRARAGEALCRAAHARDTFDVAFIRLNPGEFAARFSAGGAGAGGARPAAAAPARTCSARASATRSASTWRSEPRVLVAAAVGRRLPRGGPDAAVRHADLRAIRHEPEDISLFNRTRRRNMSVYASKARCRTAGRSSTRTTSSRSTSSTTTSSVAHPERQWSTHARGCASACGQPPAAFSMNLKLAGTVTVRSVAARAGRCCSCACATRTASSSTCGRRCAQAPCSR